MSALALWLATLGFFGLGFLGIFIPALPGVLFIFAGVLFYAAMTGFATISATTVVILGGLTVLAWLAEYAGGLAGAKLAGGGRWVMAGMVAGAVIGLVAGGSPGLVVGVFIGALLGAIQEGKTVAEAGRAAAWSVVGIVGGKLVQFVLAISVVAAFLLATVV